MKAAKERAWQFSERSGSAMGGVGSWLDHHMREQQRMQDLIDPPHMRTLREQMRNMLRMQD